MSLWKSLAILKLEYFICVILLLWKICFVLNSTFFSPLDINNLRIETSMINTNIAQLVERQTIKKLNYMHQPRDFKQPYSCQVLGHNFCTPSWHTLLIYTLQYNKYTALTLASSWHQHLDNCNLYYPHRHSASYWNNSQKASQHASNQIFQKPFSYQVLGYKFFNPSWHSQIIFTVPYDIQLLFLHLCPTFKFLESS